MRTPQGRWGLKGEDTVHTINPSDPTLFPRQTDAGYHPLA